jgi:hypothetical protein
MGGDYYDRPVIASTGSSTYSNDVVGKQNSLNPSLDPKNYV